LTEEVLSRFKRRIAAWTLVPSDGGRFEVSLDGRLLFSKLAEGRFPKANEIIDLIEKSAVGARRR